MNCGCEKVVQMLGAWKLKYISGPCYGIVCSTVPISYVSQTFNQWVGQWSRQILAPSFSMARPDSSIRKSRNFNQIEPGLFQHFHRSMCHFQGVFFPKKTNTVCMERHRHWLPGLPMWRLPRWTLGFQSFEAPQDRWFMGFLAELDHKEGMKKADWYKNYQELLVEYCIQFFLCYIRVFAYTYMFTYLAWFEITSCICGVWKYAFPPKPLSNDTIAAKWHVIVYKNCIIRYN